MSIPRKYKVRNDVTESHYKENKFIFYNEHYTFISALYKNLIFLRLMINKEDKWMAANVSYKNGETYAPFYNPDLRHDNLVAEIVIDEYNEVMDGLIKAGILEYDDDSMKFVSSEKADSSNSKQIRIKYFTDIDKIGKISKGDLIDLRAAKDVAMKKGQFKLIPLGVAMQLPDGYKANVYPRSSTFKNFGIIMTNSVGQIDESYCGDTDQWMFPAYALRDTVIHKNDRICQFEIQKKQPQIEFLEVKSLGNESRGGIGSTGKR